MEDIFVTADLHLDHDNIRKYCNRPFKDVDEMNQAIVTNWNNKIPKNNSLVIILGDVAWRNHDKWLGMLNGKKILIEGNHDKMHYHTIERHFLGRPHKIYERKIEGQFTVFCHYPMISWNRSFHGSWHLFGHCHGRVIKPFINKYAFDVGVDSHNFEPWSWEEIKQEMVKKNIKEIEDGDT